MTRLFEIAWIGRLAITVSLAFAVVGGADAATARVGAPAPALALKTLDGQPLDVGALKGKVVVVNVWATWCGPCRAEMPMLDAFYRAHSGGGFVLIGASADRTRDIGDVRKVMAAFAYPAALLSQAKVDNLDEPRVLPMTLVIDKSGVVRAVFGGAGTPLTTQLLTAAVAPLL